MSRGGRTYRKLWNMICTPWIGMGRSGVPRKRRGAECKEMAKWGVNGMSKGSHEPALGRMLGFGRSGYSVWLIGQVGVSLQVDSGVLTPDSL